jgi:hypothetical protein
MTLRGMLGSDVHRIQEQIDDLLDREDGPIVLVDGSRMVSYTQGFGVSPCQLELLTVEIERAVRNVIGGQSLTNRRKRRNREKSKQGSGFVSRERSSLVESGYHSPASRWQLGTTRIGTDTAHRGGPAR